MRIGQRRGRDAVILVGWENICVIGQNMGRTYNHLRRYLKVHDNVKLNNFLRMELDVFEDLFLLVVFTYIIQYLFNSCLFFSFNANDVSKWRV